MELQLFLKDKIKDTGIKAQLKQLTMVKIRINGQTSDLTLFSTMFCIYHHINAQLVSKNDTSITHFKLQQAG